MNTPMQTSFDTFFAAESYLEIHGFHCEQRVWKDNQKNKATVVARKKGVKIDFINKGKTAQ